MCILEDGTEELQLVKSLRREGQVVKIQDVGVSQGLGLRDLVVDEKGVKLGEAKVKLWLRAGPAITQKNQWCCPFRQSKRAHGGICCED